MRRLAIYWTSGLRSTRIGPVLSWPKCEHHNQHSSFYVHIVIVRTSLTNYNVAPMRYGSLWRSHRQILHQELHSRVIERYQDSQRQTARLLLRHLHGEPHLFLEHIE